jgi:hypothetical protein
MERSELYDHYFAVHQDQLVPSDLPLVQLPRQDGRECFYRAHTLLALPAHGDVHLRPYIQTHFRLACL